MNRKSIPLMISLVAAGIFVFLNACKTIDTTKQVSTVVYDAWWSSDYAANGAEMQCGEAPVNWCRSEARQDEADFRSKFSSAFQSDTQCSGLKLIVFEDPNEHSAANEEYLKVTKRAYWDLQVNFSSKLKDQPWQFNLNPGFKSYASGDSDAKSMARSICLIANRRAAQS